MEVTELLGKVIQTVEGAEKGGNRMEFTMSDGSKYAFYHSQDCCESVLIDQIDGDVSDLIGLPLTMAEESTNCDNKPDYAESFTWTFYRFATAKGYVTIKWLGESSGYYSEGVDFEKL